MTSRTATNWFTVDGTATGDPLTTSVTQNGVTGSPTGGKITTVSDLLGRVKTYTDVWGTVTTPAYEALTGRELADTQPGEADDAWLGSDRKLHEHQGDIATVEMEARQYVAALGRFLEVDPITGGNSDDYNYPNDPINGFDLSRKCIKFDGTSCSAKTTAKVAAHMRSLASLERARAE